MDFDTATAHDFVAEVPIIDRPTAVVAQDGTIVTPIFTSVQDQAVVVGSDVVSFMSGVEGEVRGAIADSLLLAQLAASRKVPDGSQIFAWYDAYFGVLRNIGWLVHDGGFETVVEKGEGFEVHERIMDVATVLMRPGSAALAVVAATVAALTRMESDNGWFTIFDRETRHAEAARFQMAVTQPSPDDPGPDDSVPMQMMAFGIEADRTITQVLFFKVAKAKATLRSNAASVAIDRAGLLDLAPQVRQRVRSFQKSFVADLQL